MLATENHNSRGRRNLRHAPCSDAWTFTLADAARMSGLSQATLRRRAAEGELRLVRVGRRTLVDAASLRRMLSVMAS
jgi:excisionase family DNA binding protein